MARKALYDPNRWAIPMSDGSYSCLCDLTPEQRRKVPKNLLPPSHLFRGTEVKNEEPTHNCESCALCTNTTGWCAAIGFNGTEWRQDNLVTQDNVYIYMKPKASGCPDWQQRVKAEKKRETGVPVEPVSLPSTQGCTEDLRNCDSCINCLCEPGEWCTINVAPELSVWRSINLVPDDARGIYISMKTGAKNCPAWRSIEKPDSCNTCTDCGNFERWREVGTIRPCKKSTRFNPESVE